MASIRKRVKKDGSSSFMVVWRDPKIRKQQGIIVDSAHEAETLKRLLDANGQSFEIAQKLRAKNLGAGSSRRHAIQASVASMASWWV